MIAIHGSRHRAATLALVFLVTIALPGLARAAEPDPAEVVHEAVAAVVGVRAEVPGNSRTAETLGRTRQGSGVIIDDGGLILTVGYVILEAATVEVETATGVTAPATVVAYDHESGFGLLRSLVPLEIKAARLGPARSLEVGQDLFVVSNVGRLGGLPVRVADRREFAGYWEYLLENAVFTMPPHREFAGAALFDRGGRLVGIGSLFVGDAAGLGLPSPGNMFIPVDALLPILAELLADGRRDAPPRPWLGVNLREEDGHLRILRVQDDTPAAQAGLAPGDMVVAIAGEPVSSLGTFYRRLWALGEAGVPVPLTIRHGAGDTDDVEVRSTDRSSWLRLRSTL